MNLLQTLHYLFFSSSITSSVFLSFIMSLILLLVLLKLYKRSYQFTNKEKVITFILSFLFMMVGALIPNHFIPNIVWGLLAFHFVVDRKYMELPDGVTLTIALLSIPSIILQWKIVGFVQSGILTGVILFSIFLLLAFIGPMGGGDIKLMGAIGLYFSLWDIMSLLLFGFLIGTIQAISLMIFKRQSKDTLIAFGPALILGVLTTVFINGGGLYV